MLTPRWGEGRGEGERGTASVKKRWGLEGEFACDREADDVTCHAYLLTTLNRYENVASASIVNVARSVRGVRRDKCA